jgi:hypothetical protein
MRTERVLALLALAGLIIKFLHYPGGMQLMLLSMGALSMVYFYFAFYFFSEKKIANQNIALTIPSGIAFAIIVIGILFKLQYWPGNGFLYLLIGLISTPIILIFTNILQKRAGDAASDELKLYYKRMTRRAIVMFCLSALFFFTPSETILLAQYRNPQLAHLKALYYSSHDSADKKKLDEYIHKQDSIRMIHLQ